ncbi:hypothetical protein D6C87_10695 [Aureobasidium pullulans]|uniref:Zn(2)-C6 fungal-type domain-containing protein n=1 Tax=Aureobasidium pullulans TaxID=5580 RepID=A0AB38LIQ5_AURPU|nr:hypothetical protein D6C94_09944 [Aureobasidium pullulans]THZ33837.1 hypothetical protein D6C87_10695 [Aureobasidium pullulans]
MPNVHQKGAGGPHDVRPRSLNGCQTCRRRRVKCDESRPRCSACIRLNRSCSWTRDWKFKDHTTLIAGGYHVLSGPVNLDRYDSISWNVTASLQWSPALLSSSRKTNWNQYLERALQQSQRQAFRSREYYLPPELNTVPNQRTQLLNSALFHFLPSDEYNLTEIGLGESPSINILTLHHHSLSNPQSLALKAAIDAFSLAQAALVLGEVRFASASVRRYVAGISALRSHLTKAQDSSRDETILAMLIFQYMEIIRPTSLKGGWAVHAAGARQFLETLGPWNLCGQYQGALFDQVRQNTILWGIVHRQEIPFHHRKWLSMSEAAISITSERRLIDMGTMIPGLLAATHDLLRVSDKEGDCISVWRSLISIQDGLLTWIRHYQNQSSLVIQACDAVNFPAYYNHMGISGDSLKHGLVFRTFREAWFMSTAWLYLYTIQNTLLRFRQIIGGIATDEILDELQRSIHATVWNMCQTVPRLLEQSAGFLGYVCIFLSSNLRKMYFEALGDLDMVLWCQKLDVILHRRGGVAPLWISRWDDAMRPCLGETN